MGQLNNEKIGDILYLRYRKNVSSFVSKDHGIVGITFFYGKLLIREMTFFGDSALFA